MRAAAAAEMRSDDSDKGLLPLLFERSARTLVLFTLFLSLSAFALLAPPWKERDREKEKKGALEEPRLVILQKRKKTVCFFRVFFYLFLVQTRETRFRGS